MFTTRVRCITLDMNGPQDYHFVKLWRHPFSSRYCHCRLAHRQTRSLVLAVKHVDTEFIMQTYVRVRRGSDSDRHAARLFFLVLFRLHPQDAQLWFMSQQILPKWITLSANMTQAIFEHDANSQDTIRCIVAIFLSKTPWFCRRSIAYQNCIL